jgi:hypothetical protein
MDTQNNPDNQVVRPETPRSEDPARLNDLNPDTETSEIAKDTNPKQTPEPSKQDEGKVRSPRAGRDPGIDQKKRNVQDEQPTNPPHNEDDDEVWATDEKGKTDNGKA